MFVFVDLECLFVCWLVRRTTKRLWRRGGLRRPRRSLYRTRRDHPHHGESIHGRHDSKTHIDSSYTRIDTLELDA